MIRCVLASETMCRSAALGVISRKIALRTALLPALLAINIALLSSCASYSNKFQPIERALLTHQPDRALTALDQNYSALGPDAPLYFLNKGMLLRMNGRYAESNAAFESAKKIISRVEVTSVTEQVKSFVVNDAVRSYEGEDFEKVLIHLYQALNYLDLQQPDEARVEVLQLNVRLHELYGGNNEVTLAEEAVARTLSGVIFEGLGEWSDALISYRKAYEAYQLYLKKYGVPLPESLKFALLRLTERQGLDDELRRYREEFAMSAWPSVSSRMENGELVLTVHSGLVALKGEAASQVIDVTSGRLIRIALPVYRPRPQVVTQARLRVGEQSVPLDLMEDVNALAIKSLESHMAAITARVLARAVIKYRTAKEMDKRDPGLGLIVNLAGAITEQADTRSWSTLPARIYLGRVSLAPGTYPAQLELSDGTGRLLHTQNFGSITISQGKNTYLTFHWPS